MNEELKVIISAEINKLKNAIAEGKKQFEEFKKSGSEANKALTENFEKLNTGATNLLKGVGIAIAGTATALAGLTASTKEYRENQAKLNTAFESAGASADSAKDTYNELYRVLGEDNRAVEAANHLAKMTTSQKALSEWTKICQGVYATFGDSLPIEGLTEASNETAKVGTVTGVLADALNWAGVNEDKFNEKLAKCNTEAEREALIRDTLTGIYKESAENYEITAQGILAQNEAQSKLNENTGRLGEALAPVLALLTKLGAEVISKITPYIEEFINNYGKELEAKLVAIATVIGNIIDFIVSNWSTISVLATIIIAIATAIALVNTALTIYNAVQALANAQMLVATAIIIAIIAVVILLIVYWDDIVEAVKRAGEAILKAFEGMGEWFSNIAQKIKNAFVDFGSWFKNKFNEARVAVENAFSSVGAWFTNIKNSIVNTFSSIGSSFGNAFKNAFNAIKNAFSPITSFFSNIYNSIKMTFENIGTKIGDGLTKGVKKAVNAVLEKAVDVINTAIAGINGAISFINMIPGVNISRIREMSVPKLAKGGIIDSATLAVVGESGKEAVVPLENNLEWLDKLAGMLNARMGGNAPIVLQVDGKTFAQTSINSINALTRQTGKLQLITV